MSSLSACPGGFNGKFFCLESRLLMVGENQMPVRAFPLHSLLLFVIQIFASVCRFWCRLANQGDIQRDIFQNCGGKSPFSVFADGHGRAMPIHTFGDSCFSHLLGIAADGSTLFFCSQHPAVLEPSPHPQSEAAMFHSLIPIIFMQ
jgi:hypothetical protein